MTKQLLALSFLLFLFQYKISVFFKISILELILNDKF